MRLAPLALALAGLFACAMEAPAIPPPGPECAARTTQGCTCSTGTGLKTCSDVGHWGACECSGDPPDAPDAQTEPDGGCAQRGRYFVDADGDGYGAGPQVEVCEPAGPGYSTVPGDCDDGDVRAFPGQSEPQEGVRKGVGGGDFNCDGTEKPLWTSETSCNATRTGCTWSGQQGWQGRAPKCGATAPWVRLCSGGAAFQCNYDTEQRAQRCL